MAGNSDSTVRSEDAGGVRNLVRRALGSGLAGAWILHVYHRVRAVALSRLSDEEFARRFYRNSTGKELNLDDPQTFDERQWWLKVNYRDPLMTQCTDKLAVRDYIQSKGLGEILLPLLGSYSSADQIEWDSLPNRFYLKTNNSSATNLRCDDIEAFDRRHAVKRMKLNLRRRHYPLSREWNYRDIEPRILVEPVIDAPGPEGLIDYRFFCSYGTCNGIFVDVDTADESGAHRGDARRNVYDPEWNLLDVRVTRPRIQDRDIPKPAMLEQMIQVAEVLSEPFPFCRVDLYNPTGDRIIFGEITFFHAGGNNRIEPEEYQKVLGNWVALSRVPRACPGSGSAA